VLDRLGIAKEVKAKSIRNGQAATKPSAEFVARGEAELGVQYISETVAFPGTELLGPFPVELQITNVIYAGILKTALHRDAAMALFKFLASPDAAAAIKAAGMEPPGAHDGLSVDLEFHRHRPGCPSDAA
jgi:molybdate transport system substrate-binding protein